MNSPRVYYLPLSTSCLEGCPVCDFMGCRNGEDRDLAAVERALRRAASAKFDEVLFSPSIFRRSDASEIFALCAKYELRPSVQIALASVREEILGILKTWPKIGLEVVLTPSDTPEPKTLNLLEESCRELRFAALPLRGASPIWISRLPESVLSRLHFHFPPGDGDDARILSIAETERLLGEIRKSLPKIRPPHGREVWDHRISPDLGLEPVVEPAFVFSTGSTAAPEISVIIPSYNCGPLLKNALRHLLRQDLPRDRFEILVIDDGSNDGTQDLIRNFVAPEAGHFNLRYFYFPRTAPRRMGDGNFRAGIARNLGAKNARGRILCFLDADIIVKPSHLSELLEEHRQYDVIQCVRLHLKDRRANSRIEYEKIHPSRDAFVLEGNYWGPFFKTTNWPSIPFFWKYTCTYALSLPRELFERVGRFRRTFVYYGFEDTDLGYRLNQAGARFRMKPLVTYHLWSESERSEYSNSDLKRRALLGKTAKIFYLNTLDAEVHQHFRSFMGHGFSLKRLIRRIPLSAPQKEV